MTELTKDSAAYKIVALAVASGQPISEIRDMSEAERRCLEAILDDKQRRRRAVAAAKMDAHRRRLDEEILLREQTGVPA